MCLCNTSYNTAGKPCACVTRHTTLRANPRVRVSSEPIVCSPRPNQPQHRIVYWNALGKRLLQGGVTPIDSIVTAATAVGQWSTVKAAQTGAVNGQSGSKVQSKTRAALVMVTCRQVLQGQIADRSKVNGRKSAWSTVKLQKQRSKL